MTEVQPRTNLGRLRDFVALLNSGDYEGATDYISPDITIHEPYALPYGGELRGLEGWGTFRSLFRQTWKNWSDGPIWYAEADGTVAKENIVTATSRLTGKICTTRLAEIFTFREGKIIESRIYYQDIASVLSAITPAPEPLKNSYRP
jgi:ketosteroid isomerase-like protein